MIIKPLVNKLNNSTIRKTLNEYGLLGSVDRRKPLLSKRNIGAQFRLGFGFVV